MIFRIDDIVEDIQADLPIRVPKIVIKYVCKRAIRRIARVITGQKGSLLLYKNDIHTIYYEVDVKGICGELADLDETKEAPDIKTVNDEKKRIYFTLRGSRGVERVYVGRYNRRVKNSRKSAKRKAVTIR
jgi:hypothetical protein